MSDYAFVTHWRFETSPEPVWDALWDSLTWPKWWPWVADVTELEAAGPDGLGSLRRYTWKTPLLYRLHFDSRTVAADRPRMIDAHAKGELEGRGLWTLSFENGVTRARYDWQVRTTKRWMNCLAPIARPFFNWNHDTVMRAGGVGLAKHLGVRLL
jgi:hypothetical protein